MQVLGPGRLDLTLSGRASGRPELSVGARFPAITQHQPSPPSSPSARSPSEPTLPTAGFVSKLSQGSTHPSSSPGLPICPFLTLHCLRGHHASLVTRLLFSPTVRTRLILLSGSQTPDIP